MSACLFQSCEKDEPLDNPYVLEKSNQAFQIRPEWFNNSNLKSGEIPIGDIYNNFGEGYNCINQVSEASVFLSGTLEPLVFTTLERDEHLYVTVCESYSEVDEKVKEILSGSVGLNWSRASMSASISVTNQSHISRKEQDIYVSVLYVGSYGKGKLDYTDPNINDYLKYNTNITGDENVPISRNTFRLQYGDVFKEQIHFGTLLNATVQVSNIDYSSSSSSEIQSEVKASIGKVLDGEGSWSKVTENSESLHESYLTVDAEGIPGISQIILGVDDLLEAIDGSKNKYDNEDFGVIFNQYKVYSALYTKFSFRPYEPYLSKLIAWENWQQKWMDLRTGFPNFQFVLNLIDARLVTINENITKCKNLQTTDYPDELEMSRAYNALRDILY